jgi:hypothetical protein
MLKPPTAVMVAAEIPKTLLNLDMDLPLIISLSSASLPRPAFTRIEVQVARVEGHPLT